MSNSLKACSILLQCYAIRAFSDPLTPAEVEAAGRKVDAIRDRMERYRRQGL